MGVAIDENLILLDIGEDKKESLLSYMAGVLEKERYVKSSYREAIISREKVFATGLPTVLGGVAIPHTDVEHVQKPAIAFARLQQPVEFVVMGDNNKTVDVNFVFMLALKEAHAQIDVLQNLMGILQDKVALQFLKQTCSKTEIVAFMRQRLMKQS